MTQEQRIIIQILSSQLFNNQNLPDLSGVCIESLLNEARQQAVYAIVYDAIADQIKDVDKRVRFKRVSLLDKAQSLRNLHDHNELHRLLISNEVEYVFIKGPSAAYYYPVPTLRAMGDVDCLVEQKELERVNKILIDNGFIKSKNTEEHDFHWEYRKQHIVFELHWDIPGMPLKNNDIIKSYFSDIYEKRITVENEYGEIFIPSRLHHGLVILLHIISHMMGKGVGLRHLCDWLVFENSMSEDEFNRIFEKPLKDIGLWTFASVLSGIGIRYFGCNQRSCFDDVDYNICRQMLDDILEGGNFGIKDDTRGSQAKLIQSNSTKRATSSVFATGFESVNQKAKIVFPICKNIVILRPIGWFIVCIQYMIRVVKKERNNVFSKSIYTNAASRKELYSQLKLFETCEK